MENQYERTILTLNKFSWIVALVIGVLLVITGTLLAVLSGSCIGLSGLALAVCEDYHMVVRTTGAGYIIMGVFGIGSGLAGTELVAPIKSKRFDEIWRNLIILGIFGCISDGAGILFLVQAILIKAGEKNRVPVSSKEIPYRA